MVFRRVKFYTCLMRMCQALGFKKNCGVFSSLVEGLVEEVGVRSFNVCLTSEDLLGFVGRGVHFRVLL